MGTSNGRGSGDGQGQVSGGASQDAQSSPQAGESKPVAVLSNGVVVIDRRVMIRECLAECIKSSCGVDVISLPSLEAWRDIAKEKPVSLVLFGVNEQTDRDLIWQDIDLLIEASGTAPVAILSDSDNIDGLVEMLQHGARGLIPTTMSLDVAIAAIHLIRAGGTFVPASSLLAAAHNHPVDVLPAAAKPVEAPSPNYQGLFTARQAAVVEQLRKGKANKIIAFELNMRESTVKVHVRNIMKKLKARNRTEAALLASR
jgi:DNA-binding NarL/FixJ family response regulator